MHAMLHNKWADKELLDMQYWKYKNIETFCIEHW